MTAQELLKEKREDILRIARKHDARNLRVFGSVARGESGPDSDLDLLVEAGPNHSSWFPAGLINDLTDLLGCHVDVVTDKGLHRQLRNQILRESIPL